MVAVVVIVLVPLGVTLTGLKVQVVWLGSPEQVNVTVLLNPLSGVIVTVLVPVPPGAMLRVVGLAAIEKSGGSGWTVTVATEDVDWAKDPLPPYAAVIDKVPIGSVVVVNAAMPDAFNAAVPTVVPPLRKFTVP